MTKTMLFVVCLAARTAGADDATPPDPAKSPGFALLDRVDAGSRAGVDLSYLKYEDGPYDLRTDIHGHYVEPTTRLGGYLQVQTWRKFERSPASDVPRPDEGRGAPEIGALYVPRVHEQVALAFRVGVTIPVWDDNYYEGDSQRSRPADLAQHAPAGVLRVAVSPLVRSGSMFLRGDLGLDRVVYHKDGYIVPDHEPMLVHANLGAGFDRRSFAVMAEVSMISYGNVDALVVGGLSVRGNIRGIQPYAGITIPLELSVSNDLHLVMFDWAVTAGVEVSLPSD